MKAAEQLSQ